ncbi:hypothetical protein D3C81_1832990 [compost metagenome]
MGKGMIDVRIFIAGVELGIRGIGGNLHQPFQPQRLLHGKKHRQKHNNGSADQDVEGDQFQDGIHILLEGVERNSNDGLQSQLGSGIGKRDILLRG